MTTPQTSTLTALHRAILWTPEDDGPRLAYADEIEGEEPERAEFVRVQCELVKTPEHVWLNKLAHEIEWASMRNREGKRFDLASPRDHIGVLYYRETNPKWDELCRRERELLSNYGHLWVPQFDEPPHLKGCCIDGTGTPGRNCPIRVAFRRGWIHRVTLSWADWLRVAPVLYWRPVTCGACEGSRIRRVAVTGVAIECEHGYDVCPTCDACTTCNGSGTVLPTEECKRCDGTGTVYIIGRDGRRIGSGVSTWNGPTRGGWPIEDCRDCGSTGRVPRLCPPTAQPIVEVRLTTRPRGEGFSTGYFIDHNGNVVGLHRWPGVRFVMPT